ncbi:MAG: insulinase family protein [Acidobacteria bacterium]|nr:MAG: insulinase family protein [Acidobacteriota bacterium]
MKHTLRSRRTSALALVFSLVLSLTFPAAIGAQTPPPRAAAVQTAGPAAAAPARPLPQAASQLVNKVLANGLEVIVLEDHSIPLVTVELAVKNGSFTEPPELNGLSHLYEHMFFKANCAFEKKASYLLTIDQLGILSNASTREEIVNYFSHTTSPNLRPAMLSIRDSARCPLFREQDFEQERQAVLGEIDRNESSPGYYLNQEMINRLFYKYPSRKNPLGNRETVKTATTDTMRLIQSRYYVPNNSALIITGDAQPDEVFRMADELFGDWARTEDPFKKFPLVEHPPLPKSEGAIIKQPVGNVIITVGWHGPSIGKDNAATYAADVFSFILRQPDSHFQRALVDSGLVTGIDLLYYTQRNTGPIQLLAETTPDKAKAATAAIYKEIAHFNDPDYFSDQELENAKGLLEADDLFSREKLSDYTHTIGFWWSSTGLDYFRGYLGNLRRTSRADINRYVSTYIQGKPHVGLAMLSDESQQAAKLTEPDLIGSTDQRAENVKQKAAGR